MSIGVRSTLALTAFAVLGLAASLPAAADVKIHIGVQKYGTLVILEAQHTLEKRLEGQGVSIDWIEFPGGPQLLEAMAAGSVDFGITGEGPPVFAQASDKPLVYVGVEGQAPKGEAILVKADSPLKSVAELKGKKVALNRGSNVHYLLVEALAKAGLTPADITPVYLAPADGRAAFESGSVDAWAIWDPYLASAEAAVPTRELVNGDGLVPNRQFFLASPTLVQKQPQVVKTILDEIDKTDHWAASHVSEAATKLSPITGVPVPVLENALNRLAYGTSPLTDSIIADQQKIADTFHQLGLIPKAITVRDIVWTPPS